MHNAGTSIRGILKRIDNGPYCQERFRINRPKGCIITMPDEKDPRVGCQAREIIFNDVQYSNDSVTGPFMISRLCHRFAALSETLRKNRFPPWKTLVMTGREMPKAYLFSAALQAPVTIPNLPNECVLFAAAFKTKANSCGYCSSCALKPVPFAAR